MYEKQPRLELDLYTFAWHEGKADALSGNTPMPNIRLRQSGYRTSDMETRTNYFICYLGGYNYQLDQGEKLVDVISL